MNESAWDRRLQIKTVGRDDWNADEYRFPYEPTPYSVLERLADSGRIGSDDVVLDYGCGKGRVGLFLSYRTHAHTIGIEYDARMLHHALHNLETAIPQAKADFVLTAAEDYEVPQTVTCCYFFNPFSVEILQKVMAKIRASYYDHPRELYLFFYYPSDAYLAHLMTVDELEFYDEIDCDDLFPGDNPRERIMIFRFA